MKKSIYFTVEHEHFRVNLCEFLKQEAFPYLDQWEKERCIPKHFWQKMGQQGFFGLHYPKALGGSEKDIFYSVILLEELGRTGYTGFRIAMALHAYMAAPYLMRAGSEYLRQNYLAPAIAGKKIGSLGISEIQAGSDLSNIQTTAVLKDETYIINGNKKYVINGTTADFIVLVAKTMKTTTTPKRGSTGISLFVVDTKAKGILIKKSDNLGMYSADVAEMQFDQVHVPASNLIGRSEQGFIYLMQCLQLENRK
jgi:acyl-CoA dehydrogenase